jgi:hypothetical protein
MTLIDVFQAKQGEDAISRITIVHGSSAPTRSHPKKFQRPSATKPKDVAETLEPPATLRGKWPVILGVDRIHGRQAARNWRLRAGHGQKRRRRERFLAEMELVVPWKALVDLIEPHYPQTSSQDQLPRPAGRVAGLLIHLSRC